ncbi:MAG: prephenate dehydrogenase/arogenate dehydrogenase family protein [SAR324 cluster bacterium]|nr:prephenate dehydrogenase/arogenate dehydrogenase family protein [SAR324 cluster bacterium]
MFQKVGIIGGTGKMGEMFARVMKEKGISCLISDENNPKEEQRIVSECDLIILSVPIAISKQVAMKIGPKLRANQVWTDFTSVKSEIIKVMKKYQAEVISSHPLFGAMQDIKNQNLLLMPVTNGYSSNLIKLKKFFERLGLVIFIIKDWQRHDKLMSYIQGLMHFIHIVFTKTLQHQSIDIEELTSISSPVYRANFAFACRIIGRDSSLYTHILMDNEHNKSVIKDFIGQAQQTLHLIENKNDQTLVNQIDSLREYLSDMGKKFSKESDYLVNKMSELDKSSK